MRTAIVWGAGLEGRGFLGDLFAEDGYDEIIYIDIDTHLIEKLNKEGFHLLNITPDGHRERKFVYPLKVYNPMDDEIGPIVARSQVIAIAVYPSAFCDVANRIVELLLKHKEICVTKNILLCVNAPSPAETFKSAMEDGQSEENKKWLSSHVGVAQCLVHRTCVRPSKELAEGDDLCVLTNGYEELLVDGAALIKPLGKTEVFSLCPDIKFAEHRKLFTYNMLHGIYAYNGSLHGYKTINECAADKKINAMAHQAIESLTMPFCREYAVSNEEMQTYYKKMWKYAVHPILNDDIRRLAIDPMRKLGKQDRIIGPLLLCYKYGIVCEPLIETAKAALKYHDPTDSSATKLSDLIKTEGLEESIKQVCDIPKEHELNKLICLSYRNGLK